MVNLIDQLPYGEEFRFVDQILEVSKNHIVGEFRFRGSLSFYQHHFKDHPVTPGVILTECCAQIGLVCLGSYLRREAEDDPEGSGEDEVEVDADPERSGEDETEKDSLYATPKFAFTSSSMEFLEAVYPEETVRVTAHKVYYRFNKLKVRVEMMNSAGKKVCTGEMAGMLV